MKHIILAAGKGTRMKHHTTTLAKGMLSFGGMPLLARQLHAIQKNNPSKIIIVRGYRANDIDFPKMSNIKYYTNKDYAKTNMVESLMKARNTFNGDVTVSYGDILFNYEMLRDISTFEQDFVVAIDVNWQYYWKMRYDHVDHDTESLKVNNNYLITDIGSPNPPLEEIDGRYVGLLKFSKRGLKIIEDIYDSSERWKTAYMTDLLQEVIARGYDVNVLPVDNGWIEFDTVDDYKRNCGWLKHGRLQELLNLKL